MTQPSENGKRFSPDTGIRVPETRFELAVPEIIRQLRTRGGNPLKAPSNSWRGRPDVDFATVVAEDGRSLDLYACGVWAQIDSNGAFRRIGMADEVTADILLLFYASMKDDDFVKKVIQLASIPLDVLEDEARPEKERERLYNEHIDPIVQAYIAENRKQLLGQFVEDTARALNRLIKPQV